MSQKQVKAAKRTIRREKSKIINGFLKYTNELSFFDRVFIAWSILMRKELKIKVRSI